MGKCVKPFSGEAVLFLRCSGMFLQVSFSSWTLWSLNLVLSSRSVCKCSRLSLYLLHPYSYWGHRPFFMHWSVVFQVDGSTMMLGALGQGGVGRRHSMISSFCGRIFCKNSFWHQPPWRRIRPDLLRLQLCVPHLSSPLVLLWRHPSLKLRVGSCRLSTVRRQEHTLEVVCL